MDSFLPRPFYSARNWHTPKKIEGGNRTIFMLETRLNKAALYLLTYVLRLYFKAIMEVMAVVFLHTQDANTEWLFLDMKSLQSI